MKKHANVLVGAIAVLIVGVGSANADSGRRAMQPETRESARVNFDYSTNRLRPGMSPRDGDISWCDDSGGGLECGYDYCLEGELTLMSYCKSYSSNESSNPSVDED